MIDMLFEIPTHSSSRMAYLEDLRVLKGKLANYYVKTLITEYCLVPCIIERYLVYDSWTIMSKMNALVRAQKRLEKPLSVEEGLLCKHGNLTSNSYSRRKPCMEMLTEVICSTRSHSPLAPPKSHKGLH